MLNIYNSKKSGEDLEEYIELRFRDANTNSIVAYENVSNGKIISKNKFNDLKREDPDLINSKNHNYLNEHQYKLIKNNLDKYREIRIRRKNMHSIKPVINAKEVLQSPENIYKPHTMKSFGHNGGIEIISYINKLTGKIISGKKYEELLDEYYPKEYIELRFHDANNNTNLIVAYEDVLNKKIISKYKFNHLKKKHLNPDQINIKNHNYLSEDQYKLIKNNLGTYGEIRIRRKNMHSIKPVKNAKEVLQSPNNMHNIQPVKNATEVLQSPNNMHNIKPVKNAKEVLLQSPNKIYRPYQMKRVGNNDSMEIIRYKNNLTGEIISVNYYEEILDSYYDPKDYIELRFLNANNGYSIVAYEDVLNKRIISEIKFNHLYHGEIKGHIYLTKNEYKSIMSNLDVYGEIRTRRKNMHSIKNGEEEFYV
jgi:hypothetical protein